MSFQRWCDDIKWHTIIRLRQHAKFSIWPKVKQHLTCNNIRIRIRHWPDILLGFGCYLFAYMLFILCRFFNQLFRNIFSVLWSECQTIWIHIRADVYPGLILVQIVSKGYSQASLFYWWISKMNIPVISSLVKTYTSRDPKFRTMWYVRPAKAQSEPAYRRSLIKAIASVLNILWVLSYWPHTIWSF